MRKIILLIVSMCMCINFYAQNNNLNFKYYNAKLDSVIYKYSIGVNKNPYSDMPNFYNADLSEMDRKKIIIRIEKLFKQNKYSNLYSLAHITLYNLWQIYPAKNTLKIRQLLLEVFLKYYFYPGQRWYLISPYYDDLDIINDYTTAAKKRIFDMLKGKKTQEEYNAQILHRESIPVNVDGFKRDVERTIKTQKIQDESIIKKITDSIYVEKMINSAKKTLQEKQIEPDLILMIGFLNMQECVPALQEKLQELITKKTKNNKREEYGVSIITMYIDYEQAYRFALAKLGDKMQYQYILDSFIPTRFFDKKFLSYFRDDSITWKYVDINYSKDETIQTLSDGGGIPMSLYSMDAICPFIKDLPKELEFKLINTEEGDYKWAESLHEWLIKNKYAVKFNYNVKGGCLWAR
jgi:hypothetical protein